jgi:hypothetical protein
MGPDLAPVPGQAAVRGGRRRLRQGPAPHASDVAEDDGRQEAAQGRRAVDDARAPDTKAARQAPCFGEEPHRVGQAGRAASRLDDWHLRLVRQAGEDAVQDVRGDVAARWGGTQDGANGRLEPSPKPRRQASRAVNSWPRRFVRFHAPRSPRRKFKPSPSGCLPWRHESGLNRGKYSWDGRLNKPVQRRLCFVGSTGLRFHCGHPTLRSM